jgi:hypothetical protein
MTLQDAVDELGNDLEKVRGNINIQEFIDRATQKLLHILEIVRSISVAPSHCPHGGPAEDSFVKKVHPPPPPPTIMSITQLRIIYTILELLWVCRMRTYIQSAALLPVADGLDTFLARELHQMHPKSLLLSEEMLGALSSSAFSDEYAISSSKALECTLCMRDIICCEVFSAHTVARNMRRVISLLLILASIPEQSDKVETTRHVSAVDNTVRVGAKTALVALADTESLKSLLVSELRVATKSPRWMQSEARELFTRVLLGDNGLEYVLRAYLDGV